MRIPITVHTDPFDIESAQPEIDTARHAFANYLEQVPRKSKTSKHGLMGPVGKILSKVKGGQRSASYLNGYALNIHESVVSQARRATGRAAISPAAMANLELGIGTLVNLLNTAVPIPFHDRVIDRLDYGLYYDLRKNEAASKEARRQAWIAFIRNRYATEEALSVAWNEANVAFEELYLPRAAEGGRSKKATARQKDVADFWESQGTAPAAEGEED